MPLIEATPNVHLTHILCTGEGKVEQLALLFLPLGDVQMLQRDLLFLQCL